MPDVTGQTEVINNKQNLLSEEENAQKTDLHLEYEYISIETTNRAHQRVPHAPTVCHVVVTVTVIRHRLMKVCDPHKSLHYHLCVLQDAHTNTPKVPNDIFWIRVTLLDLNRQTQTE